MSNHLESLSLCELISVARNEIEKSQAKLKESSKDAMLSLGKIQVEAHFVVSAKEQAGGKGEIGLNFLPVTVGAGVSKQTAKQNESLNKITIELMPYRAGGGPRGGKRGDSPVLPQLGPSGGMHIIKDKKSKSSMLLEVVKELIDKVNMLDKEEEIENTGIPVAIVDNEILLTENGGLLCNENTYNYLVESGTLQNTKDKEFEFCHFSGLATSKKIELLEYSSNSNIKFNTNEVGLMGVKVAVYD